MDFCIAAAAAEGSLLSARAATTRFAARATAISSCAVSGSPAWRNERASFLISLDARATAGPRCCCVKARRSDRKSVV